MGYDDYVEALRKYQGAAAMGGLGQYQPSPLSLQNIYEQMSHQDEMKVREAVKDVSQRSQLLLLTEEGK